jgi:hypothetical protein
MVLELVVFLPLVALGFPRPRPVEALGAPFEVFFALEIPAFLFVASEGSKPTLILAFLSRLETPDVCARFLRLLGACP